MGAVLAFMRLQNGKNWKLIGKCLCLLLNFPMVGEMVGRQMPQNHPRAHAVSKIACYTVDWSEEILNMEARVSRLCPSVRQSDPGRSGSGIKRVDPSSRSRTKQLLWRTN